MQSPPWLENQLLLQAELHDAIVNNEFVLHYQPQYHYASSTYKGVEALIRWHHPLRGLLHPKDFLEVAENSDLIISIGRWVLKTACLQFKIWQDRGLSPVRIAVNVSGKQFKNSDFADFIINMLAEINLHPGCLELELSENISIGDEDEEMISMIHQLNKAGILIALDDFGTGNSGIHHLKKIPVNRIKIDKTYIQNIHHNDEAAAAVKSLIVLAASLNLEIIAEGVETLVQLQMLLAHDCNEIQGYYFSEPLPADQIEMLLVENQQQR